MSPPGSVVEPAFFFSVVELVETTHQTPAAADL
jgi:hypothetical protein